MTLTPKDKYSIEGLQDKFSYVYCKEGRDKALKMLWELTVTKKINFGVFKILIKLLEPA